MSQHSPLLPSAMLPPREKSLKHLASQELCPPGVHHHHAQLTLSHQRLSVIPEIPKPSRIIQNLCVICLCLLNGTAKPARQHIFFPKCSSLNILSPLLRKKRFISKISPFVDDIPSYPRPLMDVYGKINVVFMTNTIAILELVD